MMVATTVFIFSGVLMVALISFRRWEESRGKRAGSKFRSRLDRYTVKAVVALRDWLPERGVPFMQYIVSRIVYGAALCFLHVLHYLEMRLLSVIRLINGERTVARRDTASRFLRSVAEQKRHNKSERARVRREADKLIQ